MGAAGQGGDAGDPPFAGDLLSAWGRRKVAVVGLGLVGGSWAGAVRPLVGVVLGCDVLTNARRGACERGLVEAAWAAPGRWLRECDLVVLAVPPGAMAGVAGRCLPHMKQGAILTDVCSVKGTVVEELVPMLQEHEVVYVPGHPLAGKERSGLDAACPDLFRGAPYVLCEPLPGGERGERAWQELAILVEGMGVHPLRVGVRDHDRLVAAVSHLPYLVAVALARTLGAMEAAGVPATALASTGFRDTTRVALSPPGLWAEILVRNPSLAEVAGLFLEDLSLVLEVIHRRREQLPSLLAEGERVRRLVHPGHRTPASSGGGDGR